MIHPDAACRSVILTYLLTAMELSISCSFAMFRKTGEQKNDVQIRFRILILRGGINIVLIFREQKQITLYLYRVPLLQWREKVGIGHLQNTLP